MAQNITVCFGLSVYVNYPCTLSPRLPQTMESTLYTYIIPHFFRPSFVSQEFPQCIVIILHVHRNVDIACPSKRCDIFFVKLGTPFSEIIKCRNARNVVYKVSLIIHIFCKLQATLSSLHKGRLSCKTVTVVTKKRLQFQLLVWAVLCIEPVTHIYHFNLLLF